MGKRIRHLEYYGYIDQNVYMGMPNVDLSDIRETNKEQDQEINALSSATKDKADLELVNGLSGKVDTFIDRQGFINKWLAMGINKNRKRIDDIESRDEEITNKVNEIVDDLDSLADDVEALSSKTDNVISDLDAHIAESQEFEETITTKVNDLEDGLDNKLDKDEADETYAKKEDVYTKEEIDEIISGETGEYATHEWVLSQGYIKETDADARFATKAEVEGVEDIVSGIQASISGITSDLAQFEATTTQEIDTINDNIATLESKHDRDIERLQNKDNELDGKIDVNTNDISNIVNVSLPLKADKSELDSLVSRVGDITIALDDKVDKSDYEIDLVRINNDINDLNARKADKTQVNAVSGAVDVLDAKLNREIQNREAADTVLTNKISSANSRIDIIREENVTRDRKINAVERGLSAETVAREQAIINVIGTPSDIDDDSTIYGAKKYADKVASQALGASKVYAENLNRQLKDYVDNQDTSINVQLTGKADKNYVDTKDNQLEARLNTAIGDEATRAEDAENSLYNTILSESSRATRAENRISSAASHTANIVRALTDWDGDDRIDYTDVGNGIVDVMHRELHGMKGSIAELIHEASYNQLDEKIHFYNLVGSEICSIKVSEFSVTVIDSAWYEDGFIKIRFTNGDVISIDVKELVDEYEFADGLQVNSGIVSVKIDSTSENYLTASENGIKISGIDSITSSTAAQIDGLIEKLGYANNETLVTNNTHEVAFGEYNISNTSQDASGQTIFSIGNGTDDNNRSNAVEVRKNGDVYMLVEGEMMNINKLLAQLAHETYDIDDNN